MNAKSYILGLITGVVAALLLSVIVFDRYKVTSGGPEELFIIKSDRWTGRTWIGTTPTVRTRFETYNYFWDEIQESNVEEYTGPVDPPTDLPSPK